MFNNKVFAKKLELAAVSHDASNHIDAIILGLNQLANGWYGDSLEEMKPLLIAILNTTDRVNKLIKSQTNNQTQLSLNGGMINRLNMLHLLQQSYLENLPLAKSRGLTLHYEKSVDYKHSTEVVGNAIDLGRMLTNLLQNALNYTQAGDIFLRLLNQNDDLVIEIEDTGIGIKPEDISTIFVPLWRAPDNAALHPSGSGLGLYVAMMIAKAHGLRLKVDSVVGKGTKFTIIFPYQNQSCYGLTDTMLPLTERLENALPK